jgi:beta-lactamase regulating signal transducer with metallopeptidase domain
MTGLADHLWQSSLFALMVGLLTLALHNNEARIRFWLWFAASLKFLVPFAALTVLGARLAHLVPSRLSPAILELAPAAEKWSAPAQALAPAEGAGLAVALLLVWLLGLGAVLGSRLLRWQRLKALLENARPLHLEEGPLKLDAPVEVRTSPSLLEPGLVGIVHPVVILPQGLLASLSRAERDGILAHELSHLRRRDNLTAALHMAVEAIFWFWPPVWLIGARLIAERERACDESVVAAGHDPQTYAEGILKVCRFCIRSPLACAAGASGADLKQRVRQIMSGASASKLGGGRRLLLVAAALLALGLPLLAGLATGVQSQVAAVAPQVAAGITRMIAAAEEIATAPTVPVTVTRLPRLVRAVAPPPLPLAEPPAPPAVAEDETPALPAPPAAAQMAEAAPPVALVAPATVKETVLALYPRGEGDPHAVTCRTPQRLPNSRLPGPTVCQANRVWAALKEHGQVLAPDGKTIFAPGQVQRFDPNCPRAMAPAGISATVLIGLAAQFCS